MHLMLHKPGAGTTLKIVSGCHDEKESSSAYTVLTVFIFLCFSFYSISKYLVRTGHLYISQNISNNFGVTTGRVNSYRMREIHLIVFLETIREMASRKMCENRTMNGRTV